MSMEKWDGSSGDLETHPVDSEVVACSRIESRNRNSRKSKRCQYGGSGNE
jgi:hypothetical protein